MLNKFTQDYIDNYLYDNVDLQITLAIYYKYYRTKTISRNIIIDLGSLLEIYPQEIVVRLIPFIQCVSNTGYYRYLSAIANNWKNDFNLDILKIDNKNIITNEYAKLLLLLDESDEYKIEKIEDKIILNLDSIKANVNKLCDLKYDKENSRYNEIIKSMGELIEYLSLIDERLK